MLVNCKACVGKKIDRDTAYKVVHFTSGGNKQNYYYCNEDEYKKQLADKELKSKLFMIINEIFGYTVVNTVIHKELNPLMNTFGVDIICDYLKDNERYLSGVMTRDFSSEYARIRYFSSILKNNLKDYKQVKKQIIKKVEVEDIDFKPKFKQKKKRRALTEVEDDL